MIPVATLAGLCRDLHTWGHYSEPLDLGHDASLERTFRIGWRMPLERRGSNIVRLPHPPEDLKASPSVLGSLEGEDYSRGTTNM